MFTLCFVNRHLAISNFLGDHSNGFHMLWHPRHMLFTWGLANCRMICDAEQWLEGNQVAEFTGVGLWDEVNSVSVMMTWRPPTRLFSARHGNLNGIFGMCHGMDSVSQCVGSTRRARISMAMRYYRRASPHGGVASSGCGDDIHGLSMRCREQ